MKHTITIPAIGESISEGIVGKFLKLDGSFVAEGEEIVEIETDKVNQPLYAPASGQLHWVVSEGMICPVGESIGFVDTDQEGKLIPPPSVVIPAPLHLAPDQAAVVSELETRTSMTPIRKTIAKRLVASLHEAAMLTTFNEIDMSMTLETRKAQQASFQAEHHVKLGLMSFFVAAVVQGLKTYPVLNAYLDHDVIVYRHTYDIGIAVGTDRGLVVPVLHHADRLQAHEIEQQIRLYAERAQTGRLALSDLTGGGFTITNGGIYGSLLSTPILNPPQVGILGMHNIVERPIALAGQVVIRPMMYVALSYDHRIVDGREAVGFLVSVKTTLESLMS